MNKKGNTVHKSLESIFKLSFKKSFKDDVKTTRAKCGIPTNGFQNKKQERETLRINSSLLSAIELLKKYKLPPIYYYEMSQYLLFNDFGVIDIREDIDVEIKYPNMELYKRNSENAFKKLKQPYVGIYIFDASSRKTIVDFINKNWTQIKASIKIQGGNVSRIRTAENKERDHLISNLNQLSKDELCKIINVNPEQYSYKYQIIKTVMNEHYEYKNVTDEIVRKNMTQLK